jgi:histidinol-phosphate aminotransferase
LDGMAAAVTGKTKVIFIGNPDNPAGTYVSDKQLKKFLDRVRKDILIFIDEAYYDFAVADDYPDTIRLLDSYENILVTRTFSKLYGLAGLRVGYGIACKEVIDILNRVREPFNVNSLAQAAAVACLKDQEYYRRIVAMVSTERPRIYGELKKIGMGFVETATNFLLVDVKRNGSTVTRQLMQRGVIVRDMAFWGLDSYIRVTIGTEKENKRFLKALRQVLEEKK